MSADITKIKEDMIKAASRAYHLGLQTGNGGNLSGRVPGTDTIIIKGSGFSFGECTQDNFVMVDIHGEVIGEGGTPSRELLTHLAVYRNRPDIHGIFHTHSPWASGVITSHPKIVQDQLEGGHNVYANNELPKDLPQLVDMILPISSEGSMAPVLVEAPDRALRLFVADPDWLKTIIAQMEYQGKSVVKFWVVAPGDGGVELLGPA